MSDPVRLRTLAGPAGTPLERLLASERQLAGGHDPIVGPLERLVVAVEGPEEAIARAATGLPDGPAGAEAAAVRLRRAGHPLEWGEPELVSSVGAALERFREWGRSSVVVARADAGLVPELQIGGWHLARARARLLRRSLLPATRPAGRVVRMRRSERTLRSVADAAFWSGVRSTATPDEWRRLTRGYAVLLYHRLLGEARTGQERIDVPAASFARQMRLLRRLRFHVLDGRELEEIHAGALAPPRRSIVVTFDDAFREIVDPLREHADGRAQVFVPTAAVGRGADWVDGDPVASWDELRDLARHGVELGGHGRTHTPLPGLEPGALEAEIRGCRDDVHGALGRAPTLFAYPNGRADPDVRAAVAAAGFRLAYTTAPGRNGSGTDPLSLRRVSVKAWDSRASYAWKALTGEPLPRRWEERRRRLHRPSPSPPAVARAADPPPGAPRPPEPT